MKHWKINIPKETKICFVILLICFVKILLLIALQEAIMVGKYHTWSKNFKHYLKNDEFLVKHFIP